MIMGIMALILMGVGIIVCTIWSANTAIKWQRITTEILACVGVLLLCTLIGCAYSFSEYDISDDITDIKIVDETQSEVDISKTEKELEVAKIKIEIAKAEAEANHIISESITTEMLIKMLIEKWNGELPDAVTLPTIEKEH